MLGIIFVATDDGCQCPACKKVKHKSDCAVHSEPAYPAGHCSCGADKIDYIKGCLKRFLRIGDYKRLF